MSGKILAGRFRASINSFMEEGGSPALDTVTGDITGTGPITKPARLHHITVWCWPRSVIRAMPSSAWSRQIVPAFAVAADTQSSVLLSFFCGTGRSVADKKLRRQFTGWSGYEIEGRPITGAQPFLHLLGGSEL